jgi:formate dehydrogenase subunit gamma
MEPMQIDTELSAVRQALQRRAGTPGGLLPVLHDVQDALGHIPPRVVGEIAENLSLSRAEVHGVISFYHHFRSEPAGAHVVQICRAESCQAMGAERLLDHARARLGCDLHGSTPDGSFTLEPVYCLGLCAMSPAMMIDDAVHARLTPESFDAIVAEARSEA